jgi:hypothetical protein
LSEKNIRNKDTSEKAAGPSKESKGSRIIVSVTDQLRHLRAYPRETSEKN